MKDRDQLVITNDYSWFGKRTHPICLYQDDGMDDQWKKLTYGEAMEISQPDKIRKFHPTHDPSEAAARIHHSLV